MIFTVGDQEAYEQGLQEGDLFKKGARPGFVGGTVYRTFDVARLVAQRYNYGVYCVEADWRTDVKHLGPDLGNLLFDRRVLRRCDNG